MSLSKWMMAAAMVIAFAGFTTAQAEMVHQTVPGAKLHTGDGGNAVAKGQMETKKVAGAEGEAGEVARIKATMNQWGYVTAWFGLPAPQGKSVIRIRFYNEAGQKAAKYMLYIAGQAGKTGFGELKVPADAKENEFVTIDITVNASQEWNGLTIKKVDKTDLPSPWIDTISIVMPD